MHRHSPRPTVGRSRSGCKKEFEFRLNEIRLSHFTRTLPVTPPIQHGGTDRSCGLYMAWWLCSCVPCNVCNSTLVCCLWFGCPWSACYCTPIIVCRLNRTRGEQSWMLASRLKTQLARQRRSDARKPTMPALTRQRMQKHSAKSLMRMCQVSKACVANTTHCVFCLASHHITPTLWCSRRDQGHATNSEAGRRHGGRPKASRDATTR